MANATNSVNQKTVVLQEPPSVERTLQRLPNHILVRAFSYLQQVGRDMSRTLQTCKSFNTIGATNAELFRRQQLMRADWSLIRQMLPQFYLEAYQKVVPGDLPPELISLNGFEVLDRLAEKNPENVAIIGHLSEKLGYEFAFSTRLSLAYSQINDSQTKVLLQLFQGYFKPGNIERFTVQECPNLQNLPPLPDKLIGFSAWDCENLRTLQPWPETLRGCTIENCAITELPRLPPTFDDQLIIENCNLKDAPALPDCLRSCTFDNCFEGMMPESFTSWPRSLTALKIVLLYNEKLPSLKETALRELTLEGCLLPKLPDLPKSLRSLCLMNCKNLTASLEETEITDLRIVRCSKLELLPRFPKTLKHLEVMSHHVTRLLPLKENTKILAQLCLEYPELLTVKMSLIENSDEVCNATFQEMIAKVRAPYQKLKRIEALLQNEPSEENTKMIDAELQTARRHNNAATERVYWHLHGILEKKGLVKADVPNFAGKCFRGLEGYSAERADKLEAVRLTLADLENGEKGSF